MSCEIHVTSGSVKEVYLEANHHKSCTRFIFKDIITKATIENDFRKRHIKTRKDFFGNTLKTC